MAEVGAYSPVTTAAQNLPWSWPPGRSGGWWLRRLRLVCGAWWSPTGSCWAGPRRSRRGQTGCWSRCPDDKVNFKAKHRRWTSFREKYAKSRKLFQFEVKVMSNYELVAVFLILIHCNTTELRMRLFFSHKYIRRQLHVSHRVITPEGQNFFRLL